MWQPSISTSVKGHNSYFIFTTHILHKQLSEIQLRQQLYKIYTYWYLYNHVLISIPVKACCSILMRAMIVFMPLPCSTVPKICHWSRSLLFGKQLTMIIQFSKHIMLLAFFLFRKDKRTYEKQQPQLLSRRYPQMGTEWNCGPVTSHQY